MMLVGVALVLWGLAWWLNVRLANGPAAETRPVKFAVPAIFGLTLLVGWELIVRGLSVPMVILPAPTLIAERISVSLPVLWQDFLQTVIKGALSGYVIGGLAAFVVAIAVDRSDFLRRGLMPVGSFVAALPIVGTAPILVMWYGFDWQSKAAVVVAMVFFPMLVNITAGLQETTQMQRDQMKTWAASYWQGLWKLRLPAAMPFVFNGLKISSTLALIGAIVAEFFGSPIVGMGFRISISVGQLALDMVWAEIVVAALAGSAFYGIVALIERKVTFWHPSQRG
ncbi:ABC transporter permease [Pseudooceanicola sp. C21-150M6]|uniref:ABC transporter permease n=1 Tax=Pseudooceanicola sp. C21-150M6 TaxID=3434355 RepID=UPI003D7F1C79